MTINTAALPQNILTAIHKFEEAKDEYEQHQKRLGQLSKRLEKHRKAAEATQAQSTQLGTQWRDAFRQNDGELTKEIRALKTQEVEAREMAEEYNNLVAELTPEFERCQLDTTKARNNHLSTLESLRQLYADYQFTTSAEKLFSLPEAKPFLIALNYKIAEISSSEQMSIYKREIVDDNYIENIIATKEQVLIMDVLKPLLLSENISLHENDGLSKYYEVEKLDIELDRYSPAREGRLNAQAVATIQ